MIKKYDRKLNTPKQHDFWFLPLGGCGEIGMNMNLYGHDGQWLMVDCGVSFEKKLVQEVGKRNDDVVCADPSFIESRRSQLAGLVITHAHEDHIGAVAFLWPQLKCPVYTTPFTAQILQRKLHEHGVDDQVDINVVAPDERLFIGCFDVQWIHMTHSIPEPQGLIIRTPAAKVFHTGDWKLDAHPITGKPFSQSRYQNLASENLHAMICDSTNATTLGHSVSEQSVYQGLLNTISPLSGRVVVTCFGSNVARMQSLARIAQRTDRYIGLMGRSLHKMYGAAKVSGFWPEELSVISPSHLGFLPPNEVLAIATGSQGDEYSALERLSLGIHPDLELDEGDTVIFSSRTIPGNEDAIAKLVTRFKEKGVQVIDTENSDAVIHASGHPCVEELKLMYTWVKPQLAIPVHGEEKHMKANAEIAKHQGVPAQQVGKNGDLFVIAPQKKIIRNFASTGRLTVVRPE